MLRVKVKKKKNTAATKSVASLLLSLFMKRCSTTVMYYLCECAFGALRIVTVRFDRLADVGVKRLDLDCLA